MKTLVTKTGDSSGRWWIAVSQSARKGVALLTIFGMLVSVGAPVGMAGVNFARADALTLYPISNGTYVAWENGVTGVDETSGFSCTGSDYIRASANNTKESYNVSLSGIPTGSVITSISVDTYSRDENNGDTGQYRTFIIFNGTETAAGGTPISPSSSSGCNGPNTQSYDVVDTTKGDATTLQIGVEKTNSSDSVRVGAIHAVVTYIAPTYTITSLAGTGGSITPGTATYTAGSSQTFTVAPYASNIVADVLVDGISQGRVNAYAFTNITTGHLISATFDGGWSAPTDSGDTDSDVTGDGNVFTSNNSYAVFDSQSDEMDVDDFGFSIPTGATINGIEVAIEGNRTDPRTVDVMLSWDNGSSWTTGSGTGMKNFGGTFTTLDKTVILGGPSDTWNHTWAPSDFSDANFRMLLDAVSSGPGDTLSVDQIQVKVHYTLAGSITIVKQTLPDMDAGEFDFTISEGDGGDGFTLSDGGEQNYSGLASGTYTVSEAAEPGYDLTGLSCVGGENDNEVVTLETRTAVLNIVPGEDITCTFTNTKRASFSMTKYTDPAIGLYQFILDGVTQEGIPASSPEMTAGDWSVSNILPGGYSLSESIIELPDLDPSWARTVSCDGNYSDPTSGSIESPFSMTLAPGEAMSCVVNNTQNAVIAGKKFEDMDGNGRGSVGPVLSGWTIDITGVGDTEYEDSAVTDENGDYSFLVPPGTYRVCEVEQKGWIQSYPDADGNCGDGTDGYVVTVAAGEVFTGKDFGNYRTGSISGYKWHDADADGVFDDSEFGLNGWTINLAGPQSGTSVTSAGTYQFTDLEPGTYTITEVQQPGWAQSYPLQGAAHTVVVTSNAVMLGYGFGNVGDSVISGEKWSDVNGNAVWDEEESSPGFPVPFVFNLYKQEGSSFTLLASQTGTAGYSFEGLLPGTYRVTEGDTDGWAQTYPTALGSHTVTVGIDQSVTGYNFGNIQVFTLAGYKFNDLDRDGYWDGHGISVRTMTPAEPGLPGWTITATPMVRSGCDDRPTLRVVCIGTLVEDTSRVEKTVVTDEEGAYDFEFRANEAGIWKITEEQQFGWSQSAPDFDGDQYYLIDVTPDGISHEYELYDELFLFGNWQWPTVQIFKWSDLNSDGVYGEDEPAVAGYPVAVGRVIMMLEAFDAEESEGGLLPIEILETALTGSDGFANIPLNPDWFEGGIEELESVIANGLVALEGVQDNWAKTFPNFLHADQVELTFREGLTPMTLQTDSFFDVFTDVSMGEPMTEGEQHGTYSPTGSLAFGNHFTAPPVTQPSGGGGSNGPITGAFGAGSFGGLVLGAATTTQQGLPAGCQALITGYLREGRRANGPAQVRALQEFLNTHMGANLPVTGFFGPLTTAAVKKFQLQHAAEILTPWGITEPTGIVYKTTQRAINLANCSSLTIPMPTDLKPWGGQ
jgi:hypothetical protein